MSSRKLLTIFGATGNQGGSVLDAVLARPALQEKYSLRAITRDPTSGKSKALSDKGVEMVKADLDDLESLKTAVKGSYGVFGVTDFWSIMDKEREIKQGKNLFEACKSQGVTHFVFSALPYAEKITNGVLKHVDHFDSKAIVGEYIEANKGDMIASYCMPAMFIDVLARGVQVHDGQAVLSMPFPSDDIAWPLIQPRRDNGKYVMGLFEGAIKANGVYVHAVSTWTTPKDVVAALSQNANRQVTFKTASPEAYQEALAKNTGDVVAKELTETMQLIGGYNYYGKGEEKNQSKHNEWLLKDAETISYPQWAKENGPFKYG